MLSSKTVDLDLQTRRGTALHLACRLNRAGFARLLIEKGARIDIRNSSGYLPVDLTRNEEILRLFEGTEALSLLNPEEEERKPREKPQIIKGRIFKLSRLGLAVNERFLVLNPEEGTLIRFKRPEDFPLKPKEILPLKDIEKITKIKKPWYAFRKLFYFKVKYAGGKSQILGCRFKTTTKLWINHIYQAAVYAIQNETQLAKINCENSNENTQKIMKSCFQLSYSAVLELLDDPKDEEILPNATINSPKKASSVRETRPTSTGSRATVVSDEKIGINSFQILKLLGAGAFGKVYLARQKSSNTLYALKVLQKRQVINRNHVKYAVSEVNILKKMNHPFILSLYYAFQTPNYLYMALDYCPGKDLALHLTSQGLFSMETAKFYISEVILAIEHLHNLDILYRDLKPENILLDSEGHVKLADFGLSKEGIKTDMSTNSFCGSPVYICPEMLRNRCSSKKSDIYGLGVLLYEMLAGNPPFYSDDIQVMYRLIMNGKVKYPREISKDARSLLENLLQKNPEKRYSIAEIKAHVFFQGLDWAGVERREYQPPSLEFEPSHSLKPDKNLNFKDEDYTETNYDEGRFPRYSFNGGDLKLDEI